MRIFITSTAGFIGFHLARLLLQEGHVVHGYDGMTAYYDVNLKRRRHALLHAIRLLIDAPPPTPGRIAARKAVGKASKAIR